MVILTDIQYLKRLNEFADEKIKQLQDTPKMKEMYRSFKNEFDSWDKMDIKLIDLDATYCLIIEKHILLLDGLYVLDKIRSLGPSKELYRLHSNNNILKIEFK